MSEFFCHLKYVLNFFRDYSLPDNYLVSVLFIYSKSNFKTFLFAFSVVCKLRITYHGNSICLIHSIALSIIVSPYCLLTAVSPSSLYYTETISTLRYAQRAKSIVNKPVVNEVSHSPQTTCSQTVIS